MKSSSIVASTLGLACAAVWSVSTPLYARGPGPGHAGGHSAGHVGGVHHGGVHVGGTHVGGIHHGAYYGGGIYRSGIYGLGYGLGGYGYGINGYGLGGYGLGSSYYNYSYSSPGVIYSGSAPLLGPANPGATQVISLYPSIDNSGSAGAAITTSRPVIQGNDGTGSIVLRVPANSEVWWNGTRTVSGGVERLFGTLPLASEGAVHRFEAKWTDRNGQAVSQVREIRALPNQAVVLDFNVPLQTNPTPPTSIQPGGTDPSGVPNLPPVPDPFK
ncbi:MAG: hypothetical protein U0744_03335 [Gemmataceae bacterium]